MSDAQMSEGDVSPKVSEAEMPASASAQQGTAMSDDELEAVSGGGFTFSPEFVALPIVDSRPIGTPANAAGTLPIGTADWLNLYGKS